MIYLTHDIHLKFSFHHYVLRDEMNKNRYHLHIFSKEFKLTHHCF
jgi:hypothetical protein